MVDDSYNANPESMLAAIETLEDFPLNGGGRKFIVLGQMAELGRHAEEAHLKVGKAAVDFALQISTRPRTGSKARCTTVTWCSSRAAAPPRWKPS